MLITSYFNNETNYISLVLFLLLSLSFIIISTVIFIFFIFIDFCQSFLVHSKTPVVFIISSLHTLHIIM